MERTTKYGRYGCGHAKPPSAWTRCLKCQQALAHQLARYVGVRIESLGGGWLRILADGGRTWGKFQGWADVIRRLYGAAVVLS